MRKFLYCLVSGILTGLAFDINFGFIALLSLIPLFKALLNENTIKQRLLYIYTFGVSYFLTCFYWLYEFSDVLEFSPFKRRLIVTIALILIVFYLTSFWAVLLVLFGKKLIKNTKSAVALSCIFVLGEWLQGLFYPFAFPWARFGNIITDNPLLIQSASVFGGLFISFWILLINGFFAIIPKEKFTLRNKFFVRPFVVFVVGVVFSFGLWFNYSYNKDADVKIDGKKVHGEEINVLMIQGNYPGLVKWWSEDEMFNTYIDLINENIKPETDIVLTPEIAIPFDFYEDYEKRQKFLDISRDNNVLLILGVWTTTDDNDYNSMLCIYPDGTYSDVYSKKRLVPFAERVMFKSIIDKIFPALLNNYTVVEGEKDTVFKTDWGEMGGVICYESIFPEIVRKDVNNGADFIAFLTDDSWFGTTAALNQHTSHSIMRSVENNVPWLQCSNTGYTCIIENGEITADTKIVEQNVLSGSITLDRKKTLYSFWGDIPIIAFTLLFLLCFKLRINVVRKLLRKKELTLK
jgi:apolipoprotein N-acyltransferase